MPPQGPSDSLDNWRLSLYCIGYSLRHNFNTGGRRQSQPVAQLTNFAATLNTLLTESVKAGLITVLSRHTASSL